MPIVINSKYQFLQYNFPTIFWKLKSYRRRKYLKEAKKMTVSAVMEKISEVYEISNGHTLDWNNLVTYTEKMQYEKVFGEDQRKALLSDKYRVREWVSDKIGKQYLVPLIDSWESSFDIDFTKLPNCFALKTNCGSGDVILVRDKKALSKKQVIDIKYALDYWQHYNFTYHTYETHYRNIKPLVICEKLLTSSKESDIRDYKFLCFDGKPYYCWVDFDRYTNHKRNVYDMNWQLAEWNQFHYGNYSNTIKKPSNFDLMVNLARKLSEGFSHVRVDLYNVDGKVYFGEMTFTNGSGFEKIIPEKYDFMLGDLWKIDCTITRDMNEIF